MNWAFVDYENVGTLENLILSEYERVFIFCGPTNKKIKLGVLPSEGFCRIELIGVNTTGANNLDFHLAFHLGCFHESAEKSITFHIISNDCGFNGLVNHLQKLGRNCKKVEAKALTSKPVSTSESAAKPSLSAEASLVVERLKQLDGRKRPRKKTSFLNWIKSNYRGLTNGTSPETVCQELLSSKFIRDSGSFIAYKI